MSPVSWSKLLKTGLTKLTKPEGRKRTADGRWGRRSLAFDPLEQRQLLTVSPFGDEFRVNQSPLEGQRLTDDVGFGTYYGFSTRSVAVDGDGDFVVTWTSYNDQDGDGDGIFARLYNRFGQPLTPEFQVNVNVTNPIDNQWFEGNQSNPAVAMDADGDFVITWQSQGQDPYDGSTGIYARRYNAVGQPLSVTPFRVHTTMVDEQLNPNVAMNALGNFVVVWHNESQIGSFFNDVRAQIYDVDGNRIGGEFRVNLDNFPAIGEIDANPAVAMTTNGDFVVTWDVAGTVIYRVFNANGTPRTGDLPASVGSNAFNRIPPISPDGHDPQLASLGEINSTVSMDSQGNFIIVWEALQDNDNNYPGGTIESYGIYFRRFFANGQPAMTVDSEVNYVATYNTNDANDPDNFLIGFFDGDQVHPSVGMDIDGDFMVVWHGNDSDLYLNNDDGVWLKRFNPAASFPSPPPNGPIELPGDVTFQDLVNTTSNGFQQNPSIATEPDGDFVVVWAGNGTGDTQGIFARRYDESADAAGPTVTEVLINNARVDNGDVFVQTVNQILVRFDENLNALSGGTFSVTNPANWALLKDGVEIQGAIQSVSFTSAAPNPATNKWEATVTLDGNGSFIPGSPALSDGVYQLVVKRQIRDLPGNPLNSSGYVANGFNTTRDFTIQLPTGPDILVNSTVGNVQATSSETRQNVARDGDGNFVVVWASEVGIGNTDVFFQRFSANATPLGPETKVNTITAGRQENPAVAIDADGDFVVTWSSFDPVTQDWNIYARRFDALGNPRETGAARGTTEFLVNTYTQNIQRFPSVASDSDGDFYVTWQSYQQDGSGYGVFAQRYNPSGGRVGGTNDVQSLEFLPTGAEPIAGSFVLTFKGVATPITFNSDRDAMAQLIKDALSGQAEVDVKANSSTQFIITFIGPDGGIDMPEITAVPNAGATFTTEVLTRTEGISSEFRVNDTTSRNQINPVVSSDYLGRFVITWTSFGNVVDVDPNTGLPDSPFESNVYAKAFQQNEAITTAQFLHPATGFNLSRTGNPPGKWGSSSLLSGATVNYSFMPSGVLDLNGLDGGWTNTVVDAFMPAGARQQIRDALAAWSDNANIRFVEVSDGGEVFGDPGPADIRIGGHDILNAQAAPFAHAFSPPGVPQTQAGDIHFDTLDVFEIGFGGTAAPDVFQVAAQQVGFAIGLLNTGVANSIMNPAYSEAFRGPQAVDIAGAQFLYGVSSAAPITAEFVVNNQFITNQQRLSHVALDANGDFVVSWTSYNQDGSGSGYGSGVGGQDGVFARRYNILGVPQGSAFLVNNFVEGNQQFSATAMDASGDFSVAWMSANQDTSGLGIFVKNYSEDGSQVGNEIIVNATVTGNQQFPSISADARGQSVVVWSGNGPGDNSGVFLRQYPKTLDDSGPIVADVLYDSTLGTLAQLNEGITLGDPLTRVVVTFSEELSKSFVENVSNWEIQRNGTKIQGGIASVSFGLNAATGKWEAIVTFDGNSVQAGAQPLGVGTYTLVARDRIIDLAAISLDGNYDGDPGVDFRRNFSIIVSSASEFRINTTVPGLQTTNAESPKAVAVDNDGDFVAVWTSFSRDVPGDPASNFSDNIIFQRFAADGTKLGGERMANTTVAGDQRNAVIAIDADGDFVITWTSYSPNGLDANVMAQRYNSAGQAIGAEFQVNTTSAGIQKWPSIAIDVDGDFVISWTAAETTGNGYGVFARRYNSAGAPLAPEFRVNQTIPGDQQLASVALGASGQFVVSWSGPDADGNGVYTRLYDASGNPLTGEFLVNTTTLNNQSYSSVGMDLSGDFVVTWSSDGQEPPPQGGGYGVFFQRFNAAGIAQGPETLVNVSTASNQQFSSISLDADGDFVVTWTGFGGVPEHDDTLGVFARRFNANGTPRLPPAGVLNTVDEFLVNTTRNDTQRLSSIGNTSAGDFAVVWSGVGVGDAEGVFGRVFDEPSDAAGPLVSDLLYASAGGFTQILPGDTVSVQLTQLTVLFDEEMSQEGGATGVNSIINPNNWRISRNGSQIVDGIKKVTFGKDGVSGKWQALLTLDGNGLAGGQPALPAGNYVLTARAFLRDLSGNSLDGNFDGTPGGDFNRNFVVVIGGTGPSQEFRVNTITTGVQSTDFETPQSVAIDADGDFIAVWTTESTDGTGLNVVGQRFNALGVPLGTQFPISQTVQNDQRFASVARDADGDFIVTWTGYSGSGDANIFARRFSAPDPSSVSPPLPSGDEFVVNTSEFNIQKWSSVAVDVDGDFVVTWTSAGTDGSGYGVYARKFDTQGNPLGSEFLVNQTIADNQQFGQVAMDADGDFVITWTSFSQTSGDDVFARIFNRDASPRTGEFLVNVVPPPPGPPPTNQRYSTVDVDLDGDFVVSWSSAGQDGSGYGVYVRRFDAQGQPVTGEIQANVSTQGNQQFSSVSMDHNGDFVVSWSGYGTLLSGHSDTSGVFARRFDAAGNPVPPPPGIVGTTNEFRVNTTQTGTQRASTVGTTGKGDFVVVWSGQGSSDTDGVFARLFGEPSDTDGPIAADVFFGSTQVFEGSTQPSTITQLVVSFGEDLITGAGFNSVTNLDNWIIARNGSQIIGGVTDVKFTKNDVTNKFEAVLTLDGNGTASGTTSLAPGNYVLTATEFIHDLADNALDGNYDGAPGGDFNRGFTVVGELPVERRVNTTTAGAQITSVEAHKSIGVDADGDYVAVWTSTDQDGSGDSVFAQRFSRAGVALGGEIQVNTTTLGDQRFASVAVDADGDFMVTWTGYGQDGDGPGQANVYVRIFNSDGTPATPELIVNGQTDGNQKWSSIAADVDGDFVVTFTGEDQNLYGVYAQRYSFSGARIGSEIQVNQTTSLNQRLSRVGVDADGDFIVTWTSDTGILGGDKVMGRRFNADGSDFIDPVTQLPLGEFFISATPVPQDESSVAMDLAGNFVVSYTQESIDGDGEGIFARVFDVNVVGGLEFQVNVTTTGDQRNSSVSLDHTGDFVVAWAGYGSAVGQADSLGIFARRFSANGTPLPPPPGVIGATDEFRVNTTITGAQEVPSIGTTGRGDFVVAWSGNGDGDSLGVFTRRFLEPLDGAGPIVADVRAGAIQVQPLAVLPGTVSQFIVTLGEEMTTLGGTGGANSVSNPSNWALYRNGAQIVGAVTSVTFALDPNTNKFTAILALDGNGFSAGTPTLFEGSYVLQARNNLRDLAGNRLDGNFDGIPGGDFNRPFFVVAGGGGGSGAAGDQFFVNTTREERQQNSQIAVATSGGFVVVWESAGQDLDIDTNNTNIYMQLYSPQGVAIGIETLVNRNPISGLFDFETGSQTGVDVAADDVGNYVVVWSGPATGVGTDLDGIYAQRYNRFGNAVGSIITVNTTQTDAQSQPAVAMDADGDFVVSWVSYQQDGDRDGIFAQRFNALGQKQGGEFRVNAVSSERQDRPAVAMDDLGNFVITFNSFGLDGGDWGIFAQRYNAAGAALGGNFRVNSFTNHEQTDSAVAMDADGDFVVAWQSFLQDGDGYGIFAQRFSRTGAAAGSEFQVNATTLFWQTDADVAIDNAGNFVITWTSLSNDGDSNGIFARGYRADGTDAILPSNGAPVGEFRINQVTAGGQIDSSIGLDGDGDFVVSWTTPDDDPLTTDVDETLGIAARRFNSFNPGGSSTGSTRSTIGLYNPTGQFHLRNSNSTGFADLTFQYGPGGSRYVAITGDWNGDDTDSAGVYDRQTGLFHLRNTNSTGFADVTFQYGPANAGWLPVVGDWNGDGFDTIALFDPATSVWYLRNANTTGVADITFQYGPGNAGWTPLAGDWDADGDDTIALYNPSAGVFHLRNTNSTGVADTTFAYGPGGQGWRPIVGDWDGDRRDTIAVFNPVSSTFFLRNSNTTGFAEVTFAYGPGNAGWTPLAGDWNGPTSSPLRFAGEPVVAAADIVPVSQGAVDSMFEAALARFAEAGLDANRLSYLRSVQVGVADLPGSLLGLADVSQHRITIDSDAAGQGWFVDSSPLDDDEYRSTHGGLAAIDKVHAAGGVDLLTTLVHEMGHMIGLEHEHGGFMDESLGTGRRRIPSDLAIDHVFDEDEHWHDLGDLL